jgi:DNA polymerase-3 subunit beta
VTLPEVQADGLVALIPSKAMQELGRLLPEEGTVSVKAGEKKAMFTGERFVLITRLLEDEFPPYQHIIPDEFSFSVEVEREPFGQCVRGATVMSRGSVQMIRLSLREGLMEVSSEEGEVGRARGEIPSDYSGDEFHIGFRGSFLIDFLRCGEGDKVRIDIVDAARASVFRNVDDEKFLHLIMPMRLEDRSSAGEEESGEE